MKPTAKKRLIISYKNLSDKDKEAFELKYQEGYNEYIQKIQKPDGTLLFVVPFETEESIYMVKVDVRVDTKLTDEEFDKEVLHADKDAEEDVVEASDEDDEMKGEKNNIVLMHGDYSDVEKEVEKEAEKELPETDEDSYEDDYTK